jgi:tRNA (cmo5U34)-methyltransferase
MKDFTFDKEMTGKNFDSHVREQLPFYSMLTNAVSMIVRNYLPKNGRMYDIGASTGNITKAIADFAKDREAEVISIDNSKDMVSTWDGYGICTKADAEYFIYEQFDVAVCFLVLMFMTKKERSCLIEKLQDKMNEGGIIIIVDKIMVEGNYFGTVLRRMTLDYKLKNGATPEQIINKELSLSGVQRPMDQHEIDQHDFQQFFQLGEFAGWVIAG